MVSRVRTNAVAYFPAIHSEQPTRGRPRKYGEKVRLRSLFADPDSMQKEKSPIYDEKGVEILYRSLDLLWRPVGILVRFVLVIHPDRGKIILMGTDLSLPPLEIIRIYGLRFKIELSFKQALRVLGTYAYHFWMMAMTPIRRRSGNQYLHRKPENYRKAVVRKILAYQRYIQVGVIAQGLLQYLSVVFPKQVWASFGSWMRTIRQDLCPSELVTATALRQSLPEFLLDSSNGPILVKFIRERLDLTRAEALRFAG